MEKRIQKLIDASIQKPEDFYEKVSEEKGYREVLIHLLICLLFGAVLSFPAAYQSAGFTAWSYGASPYMNLVGAFFAIGIDFAYSLVMIGLSVGLTHAAAYLLGARGGLQRTAQAYVYGMTFSYITFPVLGLVFGNRIYGYSSDIWGVLSLLTGLGISIWSLYRVYRGLRILQGLDSFRTLLAIFGPAVVFGLTMIILLFAGLYTPV